MSQLNLNYFELFNLSISIDINLEDLDKKYLKLQSQFHPDKFVRATSIEKSMAARISTHLNDGYNTLKDLITRVDYILYLKNYKKDESTTFKNKEFLLNQITLTEKIESANKNELEKIKIDLKDKIREITSELKKNLSSNDFETTSDNLAMIKFYRKNLINIIN